MTIVYLPEEYVLPGEKPGLIYFKQNLILTGQQ